MYWQVKLWNANSGFEQAGTHTYANPKTCLVDVEVDDPLHNIHSTLLSVASTTEVEKEEGAQLHATFNPYVEQGYILPSTIIKRV